LGFEAPLAAVLLPLADCTSKRLKHRTKTARDEKPRVALGAGSGLGAQSFGDEYRKN
jgi:hypothetical protein